MVLTSAGSTQNQSRRTVAYTDLKSYCIGRLDSVVREEGRSGGLPSTPCFTGSPNKNTGWADPWSVPELPLDLILLPNSEKVIPITRLPRPSCVKSAWKAEMASDTCFNKFAWLPVAVFPACT